MADQLRHMSLGSSVSDGCSIYKDFLKLGLACGAEDMKYITHVAQ